MSTNNLTGAIRTSLCVRVWNSSESAKWKVDTSRFFSVPLIRVYMCVSRFLRDVCFLHVAGENR